MNDHELVREVIDDFESSRLTPEQKALFRFVDKVNSQSPTIGPPDIAELHKHGYTDEAIYYAITVCALFNFYNRWIDASGVHPLSEQAHREGGKRSANGSYIRTPLNE